MLFRQLSQYWEKIETTASRNEMTIIIAELFSVISVDEMSSVCNLCLGKLQPSYSSFEFNISEKTIAEVISRIAHRSRQETADIFAEKGDWGDVIAEVITKDAHDLEINEVYAQLFELASIEGVGSQELRIKKLISLLSQLSSLSAKYVVRIILKRLRLGFSDMTILDGLSWMEVGTKELRPQIEIAYNISADIGRVATVFKKEGLKGLNKISISVGIPVLPSAAERLKSPEEIFEKLGSSFVEPKIDGFRLQVHVDKSKEEIVDENSLFEKTKPFVRFYSRNLEDMSSMFPELQEAIVELDCESLILEGEAVAYDSKKDAFLPFQLTMSRKRKHQVLEKSEEVPLTLFIFDLLYLDGKSYIDIPFAQRRKKLQDLVKPNINNIKLIKDFVVDSAEDIAAYFAEKKAEGLEGIMIKMKEAPYRAGSRGFHWVKYKREEGSALQDSIDVVVLGYYNGKGKRSQFGIGALLVGVYDELSEQFVSIAKIGTGIKDEEFKQIKKDCDEHKIKSAPKNVDVPKDLVPDVWVSPSLVAVVLADEITKSPLHTAGKRKNDTGYALRFPRLLEWNRKDKNPEQVTSVKEILQLYKNQFDR